jgi:hypothetical protein
MVFGGISLDFAAVLALCTRLKCILDHWQDIRILSHVKTQTILKQHYLMCYVLSGIVCYLIISKVKSTCFSVFLKRVDMLILIMY